MDPGEGMMVSIQNAVTNRFPGQRDERESETLLVGDSIFNPSKPRPRQQQQHGPYPSAIQQARTNFVAGCCAKI
jgi:hypothetical protein